MNGVDEEVTRQDIAETDHEIQRYHRLILRPDRTAATGLKAQHSTNVYACCTGCGGRCAYARILSLTIYASA
jgi:hypothetical protein